MADPTVSQVYQTSIPQELLPYAQKMLDVASDVTDLTKNPYQQYQGERVAQLSPLLQQSMDTASQMGVSGQIGAASDIAGAAGLGALQQNTFANPYTASAYMSPFMQNVVDVQQQQAKRQAAIQNQTQQAQATQAGAFGGGRDAIMRAQANAELQRNLQGIQATGLQNAFQQAQQQYNAEQDQRMKGLATGLQAASTLGNLGQEQYQQTAGIVGLQGQLGQLEQQRAQDVLNAQYQDFQNYQNYPYKQLGFMSDLIRGTPTTQSASTIYQAGPTAMQNLTSLGLGAYGLNSLFPSKTPGNANGGAIKGYANGGIAQAYAPGGSVFSRANKERIVDELHPMGLPRALQGAMMRGDMETASAAQDEMNLDAAIRRGIGAAFTPAMADHVVRAAGGGILAFADRGAVKSTENPTYQDLIRQSMDVSYEMPDTATRMANAKAGREGLSELYGASESDPIMQADIARRQAAIDAMDSKYAGLTALRIAAALQKAGVTPGDRWGGAFGAAAEGGEKAMTAKAAAENELAKAKLAGAVARQARKDGLTDKAVAAEDAKAAHTFEAAKLKSQAATHGAQTLGGIRQSEVSAAAHTAAANRPTFEMQSVQAKLREKLAADPTLKDDPKRLATAEAQAYSEVAKETRSAYTAGSRAELAANTALIKDDPALDVLRSRLAGLLLKKNPSKDDLTEIAKLRGDIAAQMASVGGSRGGDGGGGGAPAAAPMYATNGKERIVSTDNGKTWKPVGAP